MAAMIALTITIAQAYRAIVVEVRLMVMANPFILGTA